ncbi:hypothetical protein ACUY3N_09245 [Corynebacterium tuberculostearicum]
MSSTSIGFNVPSSDSVALFDFDVLIDGHSLRAENASTQAAWSPSSSVDIRAEVDIDLSAALSSASLTGDNGEPVGILGLVIAWKSTRTNLHGASSPVEVVDGLNRVTTTLEGSVLGGDLQISVDIVLLSNLDPQSTPLGAHKLGSRLWSSSYSVALEGSGSQFPVSFLDFKKFHGLPDKAMWQIEVQGDLDSHASSGIRLKLNSSHPRIQEYLSDVNSTRNEDLAFQLRVASVIQMLSFAYLQDIPQLQQYAIDDETTLAAVLQTTHDTYFPNISLEENSEKYKESPGWLESEIQSAMYKKKG